MHLFGYFKVSKNKFAFSIKDELYTKTIEISTFLLSIKNNNNKRRIFNV